MQWPKKVLRDDYANYKQSPREVVFVLLSVINALMSPLVLIMNNSTATTTTMLLQPVVQHYCIYTFV